MTLVSPHSLAGPTETRLNLVSHVKAARPSNFVNSHTQKPGGIGKNTVT